MALEVAATLPSSELIEMRAGLSGEDVRRRLAGAARRDDAKRFAKVLCNRLEGHQI